jgi:hypothetical protein
VTSSLVLAAPAQAYDFGKEWGYAVIAHTPFNDRNDDVSVQGIADKPVLPFFDRGTWQQEVELGQ